jgi:PAS domain-containing protein
MSEASSPPNPPAVTDSEGLLSLMMGNLPARVWIKDTGGRYVFVNSRLASEIGIGEKWIGSTDEELFPNVGHVYWRIDQQANIYQMARQQRRIAYP